MTTASIELPRRIVEVLGPPLGSHQYRGLYGGRGSGKSFGVALMVLVWGYARPLRILCAREFQASIRESMHAELKAAVASQPWLEAHYDVGVDYLRGKNGTEFVFRGLRHNSQSIKSLAKIDLTIVEEAEDVPQDSWLALEATVFRQPNSELIAIWNPKRKGSPVDQRFRVTPHPRAISNLVNWCDNPFFPAALDSLRAHQAKTLDPATYAWIWDGAYLERSEAQVFQRFTVAEFSPCEGWQGPYCGLDFGFALDATAGVMAWVHDRRLFIEYDTAKVGLELDHTAEHLRRTLPGVERYTLRADSARPESISYLKRHGLPHIAAAVKGKGSVEDGIQFIKSFDDIVIHPRCTAALAEFRAYSYKVDRLSGDVLPELEDRNNHVIDALRYALEPISRSRKADIVMQFI
jgi:phage terminase large subunit